MMENINLTDIRSHSHSVVSMHSYTNNDLLYYKYYVVYLHTLHSTIYYGEI